MRIVWDRIEHRHSDVKQDANCLAANLAHYLHVTWSGKCGSKAVIDFEANAGISPDVAMEQALLLLLPYSTLGGWRPPEDPAKVAERARKEEQRVKAKRAYWAKKQRESRERRKEQSQ